MAIGKITKVCDDCGVSYVLQKKCYNRNEADRWESYMGSQPGQCPSCYGKMKREEELKKRAEVAAKNHEIVSTTCTMDLPILEGSEKQVKWANDIRNKVLAKLCKFGFAWDKLKEPDLKQKIGEKEFAKVQEFLRDITEPKAKVWIDWAVNCNKKIAGIVDVV